MNQQEKQDREDMIRIHDVNYFVEAGAGAGKTRLVRDRIIAQVVDGGYEPQQIVAITFTVAAAREMQERIIAGLREIIKDSDEPVARRERAEKVLSEMDRMIIGTIHSFCNRLLTERAFGIGLRPDASLLEESEAKAAAVAFFDQYFVKNAKKIVAEMKGFGYGYKKVVQNYFLQIRDLPGDMEIYYDPDILKTIPDVKTLEADLQQKASDILKKMLDELNKQYVKNNTDITNYLEYFGADGKNAVTDYGVDKDTVAFLKNMKDAIKEGKPTKSGKTTKLFKASGKDHVEDATEATIIQTIRPLIEEGLENRRAFYSMLFMKEAIRAREEYRKNYPSDVLTNDRMLELARDLICKEGNEEIAEYFAKQYRCIYVDEFQDTDYVQAEMILRLAAENAGAGKREGSSLCPESLRAGALFVVGDPKQSIYRFRGANPEVFYEVREQFEKWEKSGEACKAVQLPSNFRSDPLIIEWVNAAFSMKDSATNEMRIPAYLPMEVSDRQKALAQKAEADGAKDNILRGVYHMGSPAGVDTSAAVNDEAEVADIIRFLVDHKCRVPDVAKEDVREIRYSDFLVLCDKHKGMQSYMDEFHRRGIPVDVDGEIDLALEPVYDGFYRIYSYLVFGSRDRSAQRRALEVVKKHGLGEAQAKKWLATLKMNVRGRNAFAMMRILLERVSCCSPEKDKYYDAETAMLIRRRLSQMIEQVEQSCPCNADAVRDAIKQYISNAVEREIQISPNRNAVRFMNLHKAKGLEGKIVIIAMREDKPEKQGSFRWRDDATGKYVYYADTYDKEDRTLPAVKTYKENDPAALGDMGEMRKERSRIEYVFATRAEEALIFMDALGEDALFCGGTLSYPFQSDEEKHISVTNFKEWRSQLEKENTVNPEETGESTETTNAAEKDSDENGKEKPGSADMLAPCMLDLTPSMFEKESGSEKQQSDEEENGAEEESRPKGNIFGNVMHRSFELLVQRWCSHLDTVPSQEEIEICIRQAVMESYADMEEIYLRDGGYSAHKEEYFNYLKEKLTDYVADEDVLQLIQQAGSAAHIHTEYPFSFMTTIGELQKDPKLAEALEKILLAKLWRHDSTEDRKAKYEALSPVTSVWVHGISDLVLELPGKVFILDYKSDCKPAGESFNSFSARKRMKYSGQIAFYCYAMRRVLAKEGDEVEGELYLLYKG